MSGIVGITRLALSFYEQTDFCMIYEGEVDENHNEDEKLTSSAHKDPPCSCPGKPYSSRG